MEYDLNIAGLAFHVTGYRKGVARLRDYRGEASADAIPVVIDDAARALERADAEAAGERLSESECEFLCMMRQIVKAAVFHDRMFIHGAGIAFRRRGYLFTAPSGTGKTTHIELWRKHLGKDVEFINGDKPVLILQDPVLMSGSPWAGKENHYCNKTVPLDAVVLLKRGTANTLRRITPAEALTGLYQSIFFIDDPVTAPQILKHLDLLLRQVPLYELHCTMAEDAVRCSFEGLTKLDYEQTKGVSANEN